MENWAYGFSLNHEGAGAGLLSSAGIDYAGEEFKKEFAPFIKKY